jgi:hypothetical protein
MNRMIRRGVAAGAALLLAAGCATTRIDGQWSDPAFAGRTLLGTKVLVSCRGPDTTIGRLCEDRLIEMLGEAGAVALRPAVAVDAAGGSEAVARAAREAGANAAVAATVTVAGVSHSGTSVGFGPSIGIGIGGGSSGIGIGGSFSFPIGGVRAANAYASNTALLDAATGREMWSLRASNPTGDDAGVQVAKLARVTVDTMRTSGLFAKR